jgi:hypothetical protein
MAQAYSGPGSPYWAAKGMLGLALPAEHPVWTEVEAALPIELGDTLTALAAPGWLVSGTRRDGLVRVVNHGTDHSTAGDLRSDSPLYARLGYSTATLPPLGDAAAASPPDSSVVLIDGSGLATHRNGFELLTCLRTGEAAVAVSRARTHWVATDEDVSPDHGVGRTGTVRRGPLVTMGSLVRGAVEVRAARIESGEALDDRVVLEFSGWPVTDAAPPAGDIGREPPRSTVTGSRLTSSLAGITGFGTASVRRIEGDSPLGENTAVPVLRTSGAPAVGQIHVAVLVLQGSVEAEAGAAGSPVVAVIAETTSHRVAVRWPDGCSSTMTLPAPDDC